MCSLLLLLAKVAIAVGYTMITSISLGIFSAVLVLYVYRFTLRMQYEKSDIIYTHYPGPCKHLLDKDGGGSEDLTVLSDGLTFISSGYFPLSKGRILMYDLNEPDGTLTELTIDKKISNFHPVGISHWQNVKSDVITLMVVNHGDSETIEIFSYTRGSKILNLVKTIPSDGRIFNDVVATGNNTFYGTQYLEFTSNPISIAIETYAMLDLGKLWYYDGLNFHLMQTGFAYPNGLALSQDLTYLYMAELWGRNIITFRRDISDNSLKLVQTLFVDSGVDNVNIAPETGNLWVGSHPRINKLHQYEDSEGKTPSPSQVLKIEIKNNMMTSNITEVFLDDGNVCSGSAAASFYNGRMIVGTVGTELLICEIKQ